MVSPHSILYDSKKAGQLCMCDTFTGTLTSTVTGPGTVPLTLALVVLRPSALLLIKIYVYSSYPNSLHLVRTRSWSYSLSSCSSACYGRKPKYSYFHLHWLPTTRLSIYSLSTYPTLSYPLLYCPTTPAKFSQSLAPPNPSPAARQSCSEYAGFLESWAILAGARQARAFTTCFGISQLRGAAAQCDWALGKGAEGSCCKVVWEA